MAADSGDLEDPLPDHLDPRWLVDVLPDPLVVIDGDGMVRWCNAAATEQLGWRLQEWVGRPAVLLVHPDDVGLAAEAMESVHTKVLGTPIELRVRMAAGGHRLMELRGRPVTDRHGTRLVVAVLRDITERRRWEVGGGNDAMVQTLIECSPVITLLVDVDGRVRTSSAALVRQLGQPLEATAGRAFVELVAPEDRERVRTALTTIGHARTVTVEARLLDANGSAFAHQLTVVNLADDPVVAGLVVAAQDITELVAVRQRLHRLATHDPLTGLSNRAGLLEAIEAALGHEQTVGVVFLDLDDFKDVNDRYGHRAGDQVLVEVARRLRLLAGTALVGRLGGDEFVVLLTDDVAAVTGNILAELPDTLAVPIPVAGATVTIRAACGAALAQPGDDPDSLLAAADSFMYDAKRRQPERRNSRPGLAEG
jgi:diguanylate cyclase (GGDEF)-like protein/PAS domain S-box-containing protein